MDQKTNRVIDKIFTRLIFIECEVAQRETFVGDSLSLVFFALTYLYLSSAVLIM